MIGVILAVGLVFAGIIIGLVISACRVEGKADEEAELVRRILEQEREYGTESSDSS